MSFFLKNILVSTMLFSSSLIQAQITDPAQAFNLSVIKSIDQVEITIIPEKSFFLYKSKIQVFDGNSKTPMKLTHISGKAIYKKFPSAPSEYVYESAVQIYTQRPKSQLLKINYQGCSLDGICLRPQTKYVKVTND